MKKHIVKQILFALFFALVLANCKDEHPDPEDPCKNAQEVSADFAIETALGDRYFEGDTVYDLGLVRFRAKQQLDTYKWVLGAETLSTQSFSRSFFPQGTWITVKLMVKSKPNTQCFPNDNGMDTLTKRFYVWPVNPEEKILNKPPTVPPFPIYGTYLGYKASNPNKQVYVTLQDTFWLNDNNNPYYVGVVKGIALDKSNSVSISRTYDIQAFVSGYSPLALQLDIQGYGFGKEGRLPRMKGYAWLDRNNRNQITIEYQYADTLKNDFTDLKYSDTFKGVRVY